MARTTISLSITIKAPADAIFAVLVDPAKHAAIDGTGRVRDPWTVKPEEVRQTGPSFPPFSPDHLDNSLTRLAQLVVA